MENGDSDTRQEIQSSLASIIESSDKWLGRVKKRERSVRLASSFLTASLFAVLVGIIALVLQIVQGHFWMYFQPSPSMGNPPTQLVATFAIGGVSALVAGITSGSLTYVLLKRKHDARLRSLSSMVTEMKRSMKQEESQGPTESALSLADKITTMLPQLVRNRNEDSLLFGAVSFVLTLIFFKNPIAAIIVGVLVWLYFRYKTRKIYQQEISRFEEQRKAFERQKKDFLDSL